MPVTLDFSADFQRFGRSVEVFQRQQLPYATARALTAIARRVAGAEQTNLQDKFRAPNRFTMNAVGVAGARKTSLTARVYVKDRQAAYLAPAEFQVPQYLGQGKKIRTPVDIAINRSGDIPPGTIKRLLAQNGVFIGAVNGLKDGNTVRGIWQRDPSIHPGTGRGAPGLPRAHRQALAATSANKRKLKLLVAFTRPKTIKTKLDYHKVAAQAITPDVLVTEFNRALKAAMATARP